MDTLQVWWETGSASWAVGILSLVKCANKMTQSCSSLKFLWNGDCIERKESARLRLDGSWRSAHALLR